MWAVADFTARDGRGWENSGEISRDVLHPFDKGDQRPLPTETILGSRVREHFDTSVIGVLYVV